MNAKSYNIRQIVLCLLVILGIIAVFFTIKKVFGNKTIKTKMIVNIISIIISSLLSLSILSYFSLAVVWKEKSITGYVKNIVTRGTASWLFTDVYTICLSDYVIDAFKEKNNQYSTDSFSNRKLVKKVADVKVGDRVEIKYNFWHEIYYIEIVE